MLEIDFEISLRYVGIVANAAKASVSVVSNLGNLA